MRKGLIWLVFFSSAILAVDDKVDGLVDRNKDGVQDVFYEFMDDGSYKELVDSNYDQQVDEVCHFDSNDTVISCIFDQDKNGTSETYVEFLLGNAAREGVKLDDSDGYEIILSYDSGVLKKAYRYYRQEEGKNMIGTTEFEFGYPSPEIRVETNLTAIEFSKEFWSKAESRLQ